MKHVDKKRLVFVFYLNENSFSNKMNQLHFLLLRRYIGLFDEVIFCITIDDNTPKELILQLQKEIISMGVRNITFKFYPNSPYRECLAFMGEIVEKMEKLDGYTFFAHNKNGSAYYNEEDLAMWICSLYYLNLDGDIPLTFCGCPFYGALTITDYNLNIANINNKYRWYFAGTFYWGRYVEVSEYLKNEGLTPPRLTHRWYAEMFPGNLYDNTEVLNHLGRYITNGAEENIWWILNALYNMGEEDEEGASILNGLTVLYNDCLEKIGLR
jgi:hypothetical protein